jgi:predicted small lipoprotein YifL
LRKGLLKILLSGAPIWYDRAGFPVEWGFVGKPQFRYGHMLVLVAALAAGGLAGCGRKSGLDLPPSAAITDPQAAPPGTAPNGPPLLGQPAQPPPPPPAGPPKRFLFDFLLN